MSRKTKKRAEDRLGPLSHFWPYLFVGVLALAVYLPTLSNEFVWDDKGQLVNNPAIKDGKVVSAFTEDVWFFQREEGDAKSNYYRPLQALVYMATYALAGFSAPAFHLLMVLLHVANSVLVFQLARSKLESREAALVAAALFAVHPIHTEAVAWIAVLPDVLMTLFVLIALTLTNHAIVLGLLCLLALLTKETGVVLIVLLAAKYRLRCRILYPVMLAAFLLYLGLRFHALGALAPAQGRHFHLGPLDLAVNAVAFLGRYLAMLVWPWPLSGFHVFHPATWLAFGISLAAVAALCVAGWRIPQLAFPIFLILAPLIPTLNINGVGEAPFAERYLYLPSVGFVLLAGYAWQRLKRPLNWAIAGAVCLAAIVAVEARLPDWRDDLTFFRATVRESPDAGHIRALLAQTLQARGALDDSIAEFRAAIQLDVSNAYLHNSLGTVLVARGQRATAIPEFEEAVALKPSYWPAYVNLGGAYDDPDKATAAYARALQINPKAESALAGLLNLGLLYDERKIYASSAASFQKAIAAGAGWPQLYLAHYGLGVSYVRRQRYDEAAAEFQATLQLNPGYAPAAEALEKLRAAISAPTSKVTR